MHGVTHDGDVCLRLFSFSILLSGCLRVQQRPDGPHFLRRDLHGEAWPATPSSADGHLAQRECLRTPFGEVSPPLNLPGLSKAHKLLCGAALGALGHPSPVLLRSSCRRPSSCPCSSLGSCCLSCPYALSPPRSCSSALGSNGVGFILPVPSGSHFQGHCPSDPLGHAAPATSADCGPQRSPASLSCPSSHEIIKGTSLPLPGAGTELALTEAVRGLEAVCKGTEVSHPTALSSLGIGSKLASGVNSVLVQLARVHHRPICTSVKMTVLFKKTNKQSIIGEAITSNYRVDLTLCHTVGGVSIPSP